MNLLTVFYQELAMTEVTDRKLNNWNELVQEINLPQDIYAAIMTSREQLLIPRDMNAEEVGMMMNAISVLMRTNRALQAHSMELAEKINDMRSHAKGLSIAIEKCHDLATFREENNND